ncbi:glycerol-3-phosphate dehydrogenase/oxidase [Curvibacter sp. HBC61]|uniref:Glycerol-3-phosphate dehydrogenase/oxidase n=1 Tax=Curvibacter cyanobacteriorum TaxID=3026422 RepID=A0ABT5N1Q8_9BURK|nr:glycerol-3-phosphate dehydrogenase/oxidase [Curvibacter sp. HBC61]MDD0840241.1 glycerol-3-phosphate dehydrogenase/oxidase [Curvibacter sp. HBC61]
MSDTPLPQATLRADLIERLAQPRVYDLAIIGGGATGLGVALDAALRGLSVVLLESHDFAKGTSSRATKLVHGGVRYLAQGNISLVREALHERTTLLNNAPHLAQPLPFVMPSYHWWESPFYGIGLKMYDALAGKAGLGPTEFLGQARTRACLPTISEEHLWGGVKYWDGQFDDARLALVLARSAAQLGALLVNYCAVTGLHHSQGRVDGLSCVDQETGQTHEVRARCVVNAAGVWVDALRQMDGEAMGRASKPMVAPSQGVHVVVDREFLPGDHALLVPKTADGRVLFAVPWLGKVILGTTDTPRNDLAREPEAFADEVAFILEESARYLKRAPRREDVRSVWVGLRPLVKPVEDDGNTKGISREHTVAVSKSGLVTVTGGKWTTYRAMAEDVLQKCEQAGLLSSLPASRTAQHRLVGAPAAGVATVRLSQPPGSHLYGDEAALLDSLPGHDRWIGPNLSEAMVRFAARYEYARTIEDVLARRHRMLFLDARAAAAAAPAVALILEQELGLPQSVEDFLALAQRYATLP